MDNIQFCYHGIPWQRWLRRSSLTVCSWACQLINTTTAFGITNPTPSSSFIFIDGVVTIFIDSWIETKVLNNIKSCSAKFISCKIWNCWWTFEAYPFYDVRPFQYLLLLWWWRLFYLMNWCYCCYCKSKWRPRLIFESSILLSYPRSTQWYLTNRKNFLNIFFVSRSWLHGQNDSSEQESLLGPVAVVCFVAY